MSCSGSVPPHSLSLRSRPSFIRHEEGYLSADVAVAVVHSIVDQVILRYVNDAIGVLAFKLLLAGARLSIAEDCVAPRDSRHSHRAY